MALSSLQLIYVLRCLVRRTGRYDEFEGMDGLGMALIHLFTQVFEYPQLPVRGDVVSAWYVESYYKDVFFSGTIPIAPGQRTWGDRVPLLLM